MAFWGMQPGIIGVAGRFCVDAKGSEYCRGRRRRVSEMKYKRELHVFDILKPFEDVAFVDMQQLQEAMILYLSLCDKETLQKFIELKNGNGTGSLPLS